MVAQQRSATTTAEAERECQNDSSVAACERAWMGGNGMEGVEGGGLFGRDGGLDDTVGAVGKGSSLGVSVRLSLSLLVDLRRQEQLSTVAVHAAFKTF